MFDNASFAIHVLRHLKNIVVIRIRSGGSHERAIVGIVGKFDSAEHGFRQVRWNVEVLDRANQVISTVRLGLNELHAFQPALGEFKQSLRVLRRKTVTHDQNVGDQAIGNSGVIYFLGARALADSVAHVRVPGHGGINFFLSK